MAERIEQQAEPPGPVGLAEETGSEQVNLGTFIFENNRRNGKVSIRASKTDSPLLLDGIIARVGRKPTTAEKREYKEENAFWQPWLLRNPEVLSEEFEHTDNGFRLTRQVRFQREEVPGQAIEGSVVYEINTRGWIDVSYDLKPVNATGYFLEAGFSLLLPEEMTQVRWLGKGPYASYPGKTALNNWGLHGIASGDLNYDGNRAQVEAVSVTGPMGKGVALLSEGSDIAWEQSLDGIVLSQNACVSGRGTKVNKTQYEVPAGEVESIQGSFRLVPLVEESWPRALLDLFGPPESAIRPLQPYLLPYSE